MRMTSQKHTPALRFKDDQGQEFPEWKEDTLGNLFQISAGGDIDKKNTQEFKNVRFCYPVYANSQKFDGLHSYSDLFRIDQNCITVTGRGTIGVAKARFEKFYPIVRLLVLLPKRRSNLIFFEHAINSIRIFHESTGVPQLTAPQLRKYKIYFSKFEEQQKIASFLSSVDMKIEQLSQKKDMLERYKKGMMQQLFSREIRFKDEHGKHFSDWEETLLKNISKIKIGKSNRVDSRLRGKYAFFDRSQDIRTSDKFLFDCEAVIIAGEGQEFIPKYFVGKFDLHQRSYAITEFRHTMGKFIYYYLTFYRNYFFSMAVGSTVKSLRLPIFQMMPVMLPSEIEQQKIANFLSAIDTKIEQVSLQIELARKFKKGLLQQMFVWIRSSMEKFRKEVKRIKGYRLEYYESLFDVVDTYIEEKPDITIETCKSIIEGISKLTLHVLKQEPLHKLEKSTDFQHLFKIAPKELQINGYNSLERDLTNRLGSVVHRIG